MNPVFPSILSSNFFNLEERLRRFQSGGIGCIHLDIMDGHFVESISFGPALLRAIKAQFPFEADCHLMVSNPEKMIPQFVAAGADWISFHLEAVPQATKLIRQIREQGRRAGLVLNPNTPLARVFPYLGELDYVMLMGVYPGRGGQTFIDATLERTRELKTEIQRGNPPA